MDIQLVDVTLHIDESLDDDQRAQMEELLRDLPGVVSVHNPHAHLHLVVVQYNPDMLKSADILKAVTGQGGHAELIGM